MEYWVSDGVECEFKSSIMILKPLNRINASDLALGKVKISDGELVVKVGRKCALENPGGGKNIPWIRLL